MDLITAPLYLILTIYQFALIIRIIFNITESYARNWRPQGIVLMLAMGIYTVTDPPLRWLNRKVPPLNLGGIALDMAFVIVFLAVMVAKAIVIGFA